MKHKNLIVMAGILFASIFLLSFCFYQYKSNKEEAIENFEKIAEQIEASK